MLLLSVSVLRNALKSTLPLPWGVASWGILKEAAKSSLSSVKTSKTTTLLPQIKKTKTNKTTTFGGQLLILLEELLMPLNLPNPGIWNDYMSLLFKWPLFVEEEFENICFATVSLTVFLGSHTLLSEMVLQRRTGVKMATQETFQRSNLINCDIFFPLHKGKRE